MVTQSGGFNNKIIFDKALFEQVLSKGSKKGFFECPVCNAPKLSIGPQGKYNCWGCNDTKNIYLEVLKRAGLYNERKKEAGPQKTSAPTPTRHIASELKRELTESWKPGQDSLEVDKNDVRTYPREVIWKLNFSSIEGIKHIQEFLGNPCYSGSPKGWVSTMGDGSPCMNQFKPEKPYLPSKNAAPDQKPAKYLTSKRGYGLLVPRIPYQVDYWEKIKGDKSIPLECLEGAKKVASNLFCLGVASVGVVGVTMWHRKGEEKFLPELEELVRDRTDYTIKYDSDFADKPAVLGQIISHGLAAQKIGATVFVAVWQPKYGKGIDDVIHDGYNASYGGGVVEKLPFEEFLVRFPLPQVKEMGCVFNRFSRMLFRAFNRENKKESKQFLQACQKTSSSFSDVGEVVEYEPKTVFNAGKIYEYASEQRLRVWQGLARQGRKYVLDISYTGSGKSHAAGKVNPVDLGGEQVIYLSSNHTNPTTFSLTSWDNLPPRHQGLYEDGRKNPDGGARLVWKKPNEDAPRGCANCKWTDKFASAREANVPHDVTKLICQACEYGPKINDEGKVESFPCLNDEGEGYGYKLQRTRAMQSPRLRAHPAALTPEHDYERSVLFLDEFSTEFINSREFSFDLTTALSDMAGMELSDQKLYQILTPIRIALLSIHHSKESLPRFGLNDRQMRDRILDEIQKSNDPVLLFEENQVRQDIIDGVSKSFIGNIEGKIQHGDIADLSFESNWLLDFLRILANESAGTMSCSTNGIIALSIKDTRLATILESAKMAILADATARPEVVAATLGISPEDLIVIREKTPSHENLEVVVVGFDRHIGNGERSKEIQQRIDIAATAIKSKHGEEATAVFNFKANAGKDDLITFAENRGTNRAERKTAIVAIGDPLINRGAVGIKYQLIYGTSPNLEGDNEKFEAFYDGCCQAEIIQMVGRLRTARRFNEKLVYYHFGNMDLGFLTNVLPGVTVKNLKAEEIDKEAAPKNVRYRVDLIENLIEMAKDGLGCTQKTLAAKMQTTQGHISKLAKSLFGGWYLIKNAFKILLESNLEDKEKALAALSPEQVDWVDGYLEPMLDAGLAEDEDGLIQALNTTWESFKPKEVFAMLKTLSAGVQVRLLKYLCTLTGLDFKDLSPHPHFLLPYLNV